MKRLLFIAALAFSCFLAPHTLAQETTAPAPTAAPEAAPAAEDPLLKAVGAEIDRRDAAQAARPQNAAEQRPLGPSYSQSIAALMVVIALILLVYYAARRWGKRVPILAGSHLGKVMGRLYLDRGTALHFVQVGDKILLIGANANSVSLIAEFAASNMQRTEVTPIAAMAATPFNPDSFLAELRARSQDLAGGSRMPKAEEDEIASLRGDIQRLQRYLREENREHED